MKFKCILIIFIVLMIFSFLYGKETSDKAWELKLLKETEKSRQIADELDRLRMEDNMENEIEIIYLRTRDYSSCEERFEEMNSNK